MKIKVDIISNAFSKLVRAEQSKYSVKSNKYQISETIMRYQYFKYNKFNYRNVSLLKQIFAHKRH